MANIGIDSAVTDIASASKTATSSKKSEKSNDLDKDAFLQLLVTQMKYQDPMNPTDNTEYMSQLAQYSSLEATMNISSSIDKSSGLDLVGKYVLMNSTDSAGKETVVSGLVQYATVKNGEVMLSINDKYYPVSDLDSVVDYDYYLYLKEHENDAAVTEAEKTAEATDKAAEEAAENTATAGA
ncbi:MAG: hypothetical protein IJ763_01815 [Lachnospiraceae bacterium]|nr:hypothetical protein [Lachnospiraceae bacterium]